MSVWVRPVAALLLGLGLLLPCLRATADEERPAAPASEAQAEKQPDDKKADEKKPEAEKKPAGEKKQDAPAKPAEKKAADKVVIPVFKLDGAISEAPRGEELFGAAGGESLKGLVERLDKARQDPQVKAIALLLESPGLGPAQLEEVRQALDAFRAAGKEVHVHADGLQTGGYVLVAGANKISLVPTGDLWLTGLYGSSPYLRGLLDRVGCALIS